MGKLPRPGETKTRLALELGDEHAARFAAAFLYDSLERLLSWGRASVWLIGDQPEAEPFSDYLHPGVHYGWQGEGSLGERLERSFTAAFSEGCPGAIALGADTPHLPLERLDEALTALAAGDIAVGPTCDGGYYLLALPAASPVLGSVFRGVEWGTETVLEKTLKTLREEGFHYRQLDRFWDIDHLADLVQWREQVRVRGTPQPAPERSLGLLRELPE